MKFALAIEAKLDPPGCPHRAKFCQWCREGRRCPVVEAQRWREAAERLSHGHIQAD